MHGWLPWVIVLDASSSLLFWCVMGFWTSLNLTSYSTVYAFVFDMFMGIMLFRHHRHHIELKQNMIIVLMIIMMMMMVMVMVMMMSKQ